MKSAEEQGCWRPKPGTRRKMKEAEHALWKTGCLSRGWQKDGIPGRPLFSPAFNKNIPFTRAGVVLAAARGVLAVPAADGFALAR